MGSQRLRHICARVSASVGSLAITRDDLAEYNVIHYDIKDIETGIEALIAQGVVDPHRIAVLGYSAGARRINSIVAKSHRFRAAVSKEGWADEWIHFLHEISSKHVRRIFGGGPWEVPENYLENSALFHCRGATIPILFLMGNAEKGGADPITLSLCDIMPLRLKVLKPSTLNIPMRAILLRKSLTSEIPLNEVSNKLMNVWNKF